MIFPVSNIRKIRPRICAHSACVSTYPKPDLPRVVPITRPADQILALKIRKVIRFVFLYWENSLWFHFPSRSGVP